MRGCGCLVSLLGVAVLAVVVVLALQPVGETPPPVSPEAAARFDAKLAGLVTADSPTVALSEEEINGKLAAAVAALPAAGAVRSVFVRVLPDGRVSGVMLGEIAGRTVGGVATFHPGEGLAPVWDEARIGALPLPVAFVRGVVLPAVDAYLPALPVPASLPAAPLTWRTEGKDVIISLRR